VTATGAALAARSIGYPGLAEEIAHAELAPERIAVAFTFSARKKKAASVAFIVLCGAIARHRASPQDWNGDRERKLAETALESEERRDSRPLVERLADITKRTASFVAARWHEIEALSNGQSGQSRNDMRHLA
jgi:hypothetical protein